MNSLVHAIRKLQGSRREKLLDRCYVETLIRFAGLHPDRRPIYGADACFVNDRYGLYQIPSQLAAALVDLSRERIGTIVDIGTNQGWTTAFVVAYLGRFNEVHCLSLDPKDNLDSSLRSLGLPIEFSSGTSDDYAGRRSDLCIIDGSHTAEWVAKDYRNLGRHARLCWFHDVVDRYCHAVREFYWRAVEGKDHVEYTSHSDVEEFMGIGIIRHDP